jgi:hypothetical protein
MPQAVAFLLFESWTLRVSSTFQVSQKVKDLVFRARIDQGRGHERDRRKFPFRNLGPADHACDTGKRFSEDDQVVVVFLNNLAGDEIPIFCGNKIAGVLLAKSFGGFDNGLEDILSGPTFPPSPAN